MSDDTQTPAFLDRAYGLSTGAQTREHYRAWAASYDAEVLANGYVTPQRCAEALRALVADRDAPILDIGCGTGLSGEALRSAGFRTIDGTDFSAEMLDVARGKDGLYRSLTLGNVEEPLPGAAGDYAHMAAIGVFSPGHAPAGLIDAVLARLPAGGCFVFSLNDHALADASYNTAIDAVVGARLGEVAFREYGPHLPARNLQCDVVVMRRL